MFWLKGKILQNTGYPGGLDAPVELLMFLAI
jgi:hypothetical protein